MFNVQLHNTYYILQVVSFFHIKCHFFLNERVSCRLDSAESVFQYVDQQSFWCFIRTIM